MKNADGLESRQLLRARMSVERTLHGGNTGSNPLEDAMEINCLCRLPPCGPSGEESERMTVCGIGLLTSGGEVANETTT